MSKKRPGSAADEDLIKLTDSPMFRRNMDRTECTPTGCATGVLIDFSDAIQVPFPKELLRVGEFDDTFGLYTNQGSVSKVPNKKVGESTPKKSFKDDMGKNSTDNVFSPVPSKLEAKAGTPVTPCLSESDSILDINNLSTFSMSSDPDCFFEEVESRGRAKSLESPLKKMIKLSVTEPEVSKGFNGTSNEKAAANLGRVQRRNSIVEKMQRLNEIINSPARTPPMSRLNHLATPSRRPYHQQQQPIQTIPSFSAFSNYTSKSDGVSGVRPFQVLNGSSFSSNAAVTSENYQTEDVIKKPLVVVKPNIKAVSSPTHSEYEYSDVSSVAEGNSNSAVKRLSFNSTTSSCTSPPLVKSSIFNSTKLNPAPRGLFTIKATRPQKEIKTMQPLKAFGPIPSSVPNKTSTGTTTTRVTCASAPVTRKFMPPSVPNTSINSSPGPSRVQTTPKRNSISSHVTPSKSAGRQSFANIRSSGYGPQPSPSAKTNRVIPPSPRFVPTGRIVTTPTAETRTEVKSRVSKPATKDGPFKAINKLSETSALQNITSGLKRMNFTSSGQSKENLKPKGESMVSANRPGYLRK